MYKIWVFFCFNCTVQICVYFFLKKSVFAIEFSESFMHIKARQEVFFLTLTPYNE